MQDTQYLVQALLPTVRGDGVPVPHEFFDQVRKQLTDQFGGVTAYVRAPGLGAWRSPSGELNEESVVVVEVMVDAFDAAVWRAYRSKWAEALQQQELVVRALPFITP